VNRYLDISSSNDRYGHGYKHPNKQLAIIVTSLPNLTSLDISGTNLAGPRMSTRNLCLFNNLINLNSCLFIGCEFIPGLVSRDSKPLEYLGLYNTANEAAYRKKIPALSVS
jgi:Zyg-11 family protein